MTLTNLQIAKAQSKEKPYKLADGGGLFLLVKPNGSKLWQQKYRHHGRERLLSHGPYPEVTLALARKKRDAARSSIEEGGDPATEKKLERISAETQARTTFKLVAEEYIEGLVERDLAESTMRKKRWYLLDLASPLHERPISEIKPPEVLYLLKSIEKSGRRETAKKMRGALAAVFRLAILTLRAENDPTSAIKGVLLPPKATNRAAITDEKLFGALLRDLDDYTGYPIIIDAIKFQILTMTRPGEVRGAKKQEFDLEKRIWEIPAERMKMRRPHRIPLSDQALEIVRDNWPKIDVVDLLFPSLISNRKWLSENAFNSALRRMGYEKEVVTSHGFRATASTILNDREFEPEVIEAALAHQDKNHVRRVYNRTTYWDQRVKLMQDWANLVDQFRSG
jgi:integrase